MSNVVNLPPTFTSTHQTAGLPGFPARDIPGTPGEQVTSPVTGKIEYVHFIPWDIAKRVGGWTMYIVGASGTYFLTHFGKVEVRNGQIVQAGQRIGTVAAVPQNAWGAHIHEGFHSGPYQPLGGQQPSTPASPAPPDSTSAGTQGSTGMGGTQAAGCATLMAVAMSVWFSLGAATYAIVSHLV